MFWTKPIQNNLQCSYRATRVNSCHIILHYFKYWLLKQVKVQKANYRTALWKLGTLPKFSKTLMVDMNLDWDMNICQVCLTVLSKNNLFGPPELAVPEKHKRFQPISVWKYYSKFCQIFYIYLFFKSCFKDYCFYSDCYNIRYRPTLSITQSNHQCAYALFITTIKPPLLSL